MAEGTAWSFKGHMKTADGYGFTLASLIVVPLATSLLVIVWQDAPAAVERICAAAGFLFSSFALMSTLASNKEKADQTISAHMELGNKYLAVYDEIKVAATNMNAVDQAKLTYFQKKIAELNGQTHHLKITLIGRWWCWWKIEKEMDLGWIKK